MTNRRRIIGLAVAVTLAIGTLLTFQEVQDRDRFGTTTATDMRPRDLTGMEAPRTFGRCVIMAGSRDDLRIRWRACSPVLPLAFFAQMDVEDATRLEDGAGYYMEYSSNHPLPAGTKLYLNCGNLRSRGCGGSESLLLVGRKGSGVWDIGAATNSEQTTSEMEEKAAVVLISLWES